MAFSASAEFGQFKHGASVLELAATSAAVAPALARKSGILMISDQRTMPFRAPAQAAAEAMPAQTRGHPRGNSLSTASRSSGPSMSAGAK
jgi:hypothetical protein